KRPRRVHVLDWAVAIGRSKFVGYCPKFISTVRVLEALVRVPPRRCGGPIRRDAGPRDEPIAIRHAARSSAETRQSMSHQGRVVGRDLRFRVVGTSSECRELSTGATLRL